MNVIKYVMNVFYLITFNYVTQRFPCGEKDIALKQSHQHIGRKCLDRLQSHRSWIFFHKLLFSSANHHSMPEIQLKSIVTRSKDLNIVTCVGGYLNYLPFDDGKRKCNCDKSPTKTSMATFDLVTSCLTVR